MGVRAEDKDEDTALSGIAAFEEFLKSINMPTSIRELGIDPTDEEIKEMALKCSRDKTRTIGPEGIRALDINDMENIYRAAL